MKKQILFGIIFVAALMVFSMVFTPAVFAGNKEHTITIVNNSDTDLKPANNTHRVGYTSTTACSKLPPDSCSTLDMVPPSTIAKNSTATIKMIGPEGCNVSMWQTYYKPGNAGSLGQIQCSRSPVNACNSVNQNYTCTVSQANVNSAKNGTNTTGAVTVQAQ
ncbi:MAG: hypothetical protein WAW61_20645 [Methylococcaceae bacterium]